PPSPLPLRDSPNPHQAARFTPVPTPLERLTKPPPGSEIYPHSPNPHQAARFTPVPTPLERLTKPPPGSEMAPVPTPLERLTKPPPGSEMCPPSPLPLSDLPYPHRAAR
ncbi:predicted protein, partial [Nematostella vectensis]